MLLHITPHPNTVARIRIVGKSLNYSAGKCTLIICKFDFKGLESTFLNIIFFIAYCFFITIKPSFRKKYYSFLACI